ncbi:MAG: LysE family transporter [Bacteroidetes bacterium]|nr:LysE family transporter [Bacteroidota bacterium]
MKRNIWFGILLVFTCGIGVSFLGAAPLGVLNIAALQISISRGQTAGMLYSAGAISIEMIFIWFSLIGVEWIQKNARLFLLIEWITIAVVTSLAINSFLSALHPTAKNLDNLFLNPDMPAYLIGVSFRALMPTMVPFWLGWNTLLFSKDILQPNLKFYYAYITGAGLGTFIAHLLYILGGEFAAQTFQTHQSAFNWSIGGLFLFIALFQTGKMLWPKPTPLPNQNTGSIPHHSGHSQW